MFKKLLLLFSFAALAVGGVSAGAQAQTGQQAPAQSPPAANPSKAEQIGSALSTLRSYLPGGDNDEQPDKISLEKWQKEFSNPAGCWGCVLFSKMASVTLEKGKQGEAMFKSGAIGALNAFMGLWLVWQLYLLASPSNANSPVQTIDAIWQRLVIHAIVLFILSVGPFGYIMEDFVFPTMGAVMSSASSMLTTGGDCSGSGAGTAAVGGALVSGGTGLMCAMHLEMGKGMGLGAFLMDTAEFDIIGMRFEIFQMIGGLIIFLAFMMMLVMMPFRLFDALIRIAVVSVILPVVVLAYQFKPTRGVVKQAATSILAAGLTFFFTAFAVSVSVALLQDVASPVLAAVTDDSSDSFVGPLSGNQFMVLVASAIGMAAFIKQAGTIAAEFAGFQGSMGGVGGAGAAAVGGAVVAVAGGGAMVAGRAGMQSVGAAKAGVARLRSRGKDGGDGGGGGAPAGPGQVEARP